MKYVRAGFYKERYWVTEDGDVIDTLRKIKLRKSRQSLGYIQVSINGKLEYLHRVVANVFITKTDDKTEIDHIDGDKTNNNVSNLRWVTKSENIKSSFINAQNFTSEERMRKMRETRVFKPVINIVTGKKYTSLKDVSKKLGINYHTLYGQLNVNKVNNSNFRWLSENV